MDINNVWKKTLAQIQIRLQDDAIFNRYFKYTRIVKVENGIATIATTGSFISQIINSRYKDIFLPLLSQNYGKKLTLQFVVDKELHDLSQRDKNEVIIENESVPLLNIKNGDDSDLSDKISRANLNTKFSFSNYILGESNRFAHAAAVAVAKGGNNSMNPLFIYGTTGLGKTHLAQAVGRSILERDIRRRVLYVPSETFLNDLVSAIRTSKTNEFRKKYRELDCLIIDDIQMISRWVETQSEFFNTFNALAQADKQVILISDRPPEEIEKLEERIKSRFHGGLTAHISAPELETRYAILLQKQKEHLTNLSNQALRDIARLVVGNVRELEGALTKVNLMQSLSTTHEFTYLEIENILGKKSVDEKRKSISPVEVLKIVSEYYGYKISEMKSSRRTASLSLARQVCMFILNREFGLKLDDIARIFNKRDHTTIIHARKKVEEKMMKEPEFNLEIEQLVNKILS